MTIKFLGNIEDLLKIFCTLPCYLRACCTALQPHDKPCSPWSNFKSITVVAPEVGSVILTPSCGISRKKPREWTTSPRFFKALSSASEAFSPGTGFYTLSSGSWSPVKSNIICWRVYPFTPGAGGSRGRRHASALKKLRLGKVAA